MKTAWLFLLSFLTCSAVIASERSLYEFSWLDKDKEIYVLQNRRYRKAGKAYVSALGTKTISGAFIDAYGGSVRAGYFFKEDWGIEGVFGKSTGNENDAAKGVEQQQAEAFYRKVDTYMGAMAMWSPFYSKINTFNKVFYYDWMFGLGLASVKYLDNRGEFEAPENSTLTSNSDLGLLWNTGLRVYMSDRWALRIDFTGLHVKPGSDSYTKGGNTVETTSVFSNYDLSLGLNYTF